MLKSETQKSAKSFELDFANGAKKQLKRLDTESRFKENEQPENSPVFVKLQRPKSSKGGVQFTNMSDFNKSGMLI